jgi:hypothetical protein
MAKGKRGTVVTHALRNKWIEDWKKINEKSPYYFSFLKTQDIKSYGSKSRTPSYVIIGQDLNLLSVNERLFYYQLLFDNKITWVKEQYPLLELERAMLMAKRLNIRYPTYPYSACVEVVMTSDFYCGNIFGSENVYSIKDVKAFASNVTAKKKKNLIDKEKIQRMFWETQGVKYHLILSSSIKNTFTQNLEMLAPSIHLGLHNEIILDRWASSFKLNLNADSNIRLSQLLTEVSKHSDISYLDSISLFHHCLWHKHIKANLNIPLFLEKSVSQFELEVA